MSNASEMPTGGNCQTAAAAGVFDSMNLEAFDAEAYAESNPSATHIETMLAMSAHNRLMVEAEYKAKSECNSCLKRDDCLEWVLGLESGYDIDILALGDDDELPVLVFGVVGGLNQAERAIEAALRAERAKAEQEAARELAIPVRSRW